MDNKTNRGLLAYVLLCFWLLLNDYTEYFFRISYSSALVISAALTAVIWHFFIKKHVSPSKIHLNAFDAIAIGVILVFALMRIVIPDASNDTLNYHIYFQQFLGRDFVNYDFFPNRVMNEVSLYFADRLFYVFRFFLGYRMGTTLNIIVSVLFYTMLRDFISNICKTMRAGGINNLAVSLIALSCVLSENFLLDFNIYYVDLLALPLMLECVQAVIFDEKSSSDRIVFLGFLFGLSVSMKMSNAFFLAPLAIMYFIKFKKSFNLKNTAFAAAAALFTVFLYLYISFRLTGNPLFPYLNSIFKSPYFATNISPNNLANFYFEFGPKSALQFIFWPVYIIINPKLCANAGFYLGCILQCFIILFAALISRRKYGRKILLLDIIWLMFYFLYLCGVNGFNRYAIIMDCLATAIVGIYSVLWLCERKKGFLLKLLSVVALISVAACVFVSVKDVNIKNRNRAGSLSLITAPDEHAANLRYVFRDYESGISESLVNDIDYWYVYPYTSGYAVLIKPDVPMITGRFGVTNDKSEEIYNKNISAMKGKNVYTVTKDEDLEYTLKDLKDSGFDITDIYITGSNFYDATGSLVLIKLAYAGSAQKISSLYTVKTSSGMSTSVSDGSTVLIGPDNASSDLGKTGFSVKAELVTPFESRTLFNASWKPNDSYIKKEITLTDAEKIAGAKLRLTFASDEYGFVNVVTQNGE